ncbi:hypothetical protein RB195_007601 [Necator americanus]|uniref:Uncharacterized protein n=1 Tax=Necator americanus TaxID=51031 RepID=A0ABR1BZM9_NECAM
MDSFNTSFSRYDQLQDFVISVVLFLVFAIALTALCSSLLWCHFFVIFNKDKKKSKTTEDELSCCTV